jgi:hypothetical protein
MLAPVAAGPAPLGHVPPVTLVPAPPAANADVRPLEERYQVKPESPSVTILIQFLTIGVGSIETAK